MRAVVFGLSLVAALAGCNRPATSDAAAAESTAALATASAPAAAASSAPTGFSSSSVPESTASLPPFPLFNPLDGLTNILSERDAVRAFDRDWFVAGEETIAVEGKMFRGEYNLTGERPYTSLEFLRNYQQAITKLGGQRIAGTISTNPVRIKLAESGAKPSSHCMIDPCDEADFYLIRQSGKEWWITVATGSFPLHGYVVVLERAAMAESYSFLDAAALKAQLDAKGRVPVYIEFDTDQATLRPATRPAIAEIIALLRGNPELKVSIEGHTDDTGTPARNQALSLARAEAVRAELIAAGIAPARLRTAGFGSSRPLAPSTGDDARARNRRVELVKF